MEMCGFPIGYMPYFWQVRVGRGRTADPDDGFQFLSAFY